MGTFLVSAGRAICQSLSSPTARGARNKWYLDEEEEEDSDDEEPELEEESESESEEEEEDSAACSICSAAKRCCIMISLGLFFSHFCSSSLNNGRCSVTRSRGVAVQLQRGDCCASHGLAVT